MWNGIWDITSNEVHLCGFLRHEFLLYHVLEAVFQGIARNLLRLVSFGVAGDILLKFFCDDRGIIHQGDDIFPFLVAPLTGKGDEHSSEEKIKNKAAYSHATSFHKALHCNLFRKKINKIVCSCLNLGKLVS